MCMVIVRVDGVEKFIYVDLRRPCIEIVILIYTHTRSLSVSLSDSEGHLTPNKFPLIGRNK